MCPSALQLYKIINSGQNRRTHKLVIHFYQRHFQDKEILQCKISKGLTWHGGIDHGQGSLNDGKN